MRQIIERSLRARNDASRIAPTGTRNFAKSFLGAAKNRSASRRTHRLARVHRYDGAYIRYCIRMCSGLECT